MTIEQLSEAIYQYIDLKLGQIKTQLFHNPSANRQVDFEEFEKEYMQEYSGQKPLKHETFTMFLDLLQKMGFGNDTPFGGNTLNTLEALDFYTSAGGASVQLSGNHSVIGTDQFGLLVLNNGNYGLSTQVAFAYSGGGDGIWMRSGQPLGWSDWVKVSSDLREVAVNTPLKNQVLKFNGSKWVNADKDYSFTFAITGFTCTAGDNGAVFEYGGADAVLAAMYAATFDLQFLNGAPPTTAISNPNGNMTVTGVSGENDVAIKHPASPGVLTLTASATVGGETASRSINYYFYNRIKWGVASKNTGLEALDFTNLSGNSLSNSRVRDITHTVGAGEYFVYAYPKRLGTAVFWVNGISGGFKAPQTIEITNASGYKEDYYVYASDNSNLGTLTFNIK